MNRSNTHIRNREYEIATESSKKCMNKARFFLILYLFLNIAKHQPTIAATCLQKTKLYIRFQMNFLLKKVNCKIKRRSTHSISCIRHACMYNISKYVVYNLVTLHPRSKIKRRSVHSISFRRHIVYIIFQNKLFTT